MSTSKRNKQNKNQQVKETYNAVSRRNFIGKSTLATFGALLGTNMVFAKNFPKEFIPVGPQGDGIGNGIEGKSEKLETLNDKPINAETPAHLLDNKLTPNDLFFVRNNGIPPSTINSNEWTLKIEDESVKQNKVHTLNDLKTKFKQHSFNLTIECGGNGRTEFNPPAKGNQWKLGAVGCAKWTGIKLKDVLNDLGLKDDAVYIGYYGADTHVSGDSNKVVISRGVPIAKALEEEALIAWKMNDQDLPLMNGYPLRLVFGGWPASTSGKWLNKIAVRNKEHDGLKMAGQSYRVPKFSVAPGTKVADEDMKVIEAMPVKSIITYPKTGAMVKGTKSFEVRGHAWAGDSRIEKVEVSIDFGVTCKLCELTAAENKNAWQHFTTSISLPQNGYYEVWAKATDEKGIQQPMIVPGWNPRGYLNNACYRIAVKRN